MKHEIYLKGIPGKKYGIWNTVTKRFQFGISEDTPMLAVARLYQKIGDDAKKWRFEARELPEKKTRIIGCDTCENYGWSMPQCIECNKANGYKWYRERKVTQ